jgi:predicted kinase
MQPKVIILRGLPGSGKSTWAKDYVERNAGWLRVNKDDLRSMFHDGVWSKQNESIVLAARDSIIVTALQGGVNVIVDDTNFNSRHVSEITELAKQYNAYVEVKDFDVDLDVCLARNAERSGKARVPDKVILDMYEKYVLPHKPKLELDPALEKAVVVDLDGTLAIHNGRQPFDFSQCYTDSVNPAVLECVKALHRAGIQILFVTGREDVCRAETVRWLNDKCGLIHFELHMRKKNDNRKDSLVKEEIYKERILPKYYVHFVLDDRQQVVDHMRGLGLTVFQVAPGKY